MADTKIYPVLTAILGLGGRNLDGKRSVVKVSDIVRVSGVSTKEVKRILAVNDGVLAKNEKGSLLGVKLVAAASDQGLIVQRREVVKGSGFYCQFFFGGKSLGGVYNLDRPEGDQAAEDAHTAHEKERGVPVCRSLGDMSDAILAQVWKESQL